MTNESIEVWENDVKNLEMEDTLVINAGPRVWKGIKLKMSSFKENLSRMEIGGLRSN
jgi:hypothetical protein